MFAVFYVLIMLLVFVLIFVWGIVVAANLAPQQKDGAWFITCIHIKSSTKHPTRNEYKVDRWDRTFGYYREYKKARQAVQENRCNIHECLYEYLVIERVCEGIHPLADKEEWFRWQGEWVPCQRPVELQGLTNWALG